MKDKKTLIQEKIDKFIKNTYTVKFINSLSEEYTIPRYNVYKSPIYKLDKGEFNYYRFIINKDKLFFNKNWFEVKLIFCINTKRYPFIDSIDENTPNGVSYIAKEYILFSNFKIRNKLRKGIKELIRISDDKLMKESYEKYGIDVNLMERKLKLEKIKKKIKNAVN